MRILVTGSAGHLGEALRLRLQGLGHEVRGLDSRPSASTDIEASITSRTALRRALRGVNAVVHTATLHKPHQATHSRQDFIDTNVTGTSILLEEAIAADVDRFVFTSTTSVFGDALTPPANAPAVWIDETVAPLPKNIYGATKWAAEHLCRLHWRSHNLPCLILRTARFFAEADDRREVREAYEDGNIKLNELLYRRADIEDMVSAHLAALDRAPVLGFGTYVISATTPFQQEDLSELRANAVAVVRRRVPGYESEYAHRGWRMFPGIERVYDNSRARHDLGWAPRHDFASVLQRLRDGQDPRSELARRIGNKGYHAQVFSDGPYPVEPSA